jgi:hypothetical protein
MLLATARVSGLGKALSDGLAAWRATRTVHDLGKTVLDLAVAIALGGDCLADVAGRPISAGAVRSGGLGSDGEPVERRARRATS